MLTHLRSISSPCKIGQFIGNVNFFQKSSHYTKSLFEIFKINLNMFFREIPSMMFSKTFIYSSRYGFCRYQNTFRKIERCHMSARDPFANLDHAPRSAHHFDLHIYVIKWLCRRSSVISFIWELRFYDSMWLCPSEVFLYKYWKNFERREIKNITLSWNYF